MKNLNTFVIVAFSLLVAPSAQAAKWSNQFIEFELPPKWNCTLEGAEWVCQSTDEVKKRDAIIVLAAKLRGTQDTLDQYLAHLKGAKYYTSVKGKPVKSEPKYSKYIDLGEQNWVDSLHLESEIPGFYTRYLATIKKDIGVLVTYSISKDRYSEYLNQFESLAKSLKVFRKEGAINVKPKDGSLFEGSLPEKIQSATVFPQAVVPDEMEEKSTAPKSEDSNSFLFLVAIIAGVAGFLIWKRRRNS